jgi:hypothetical protein
MENKKDFYKGDAINILEYWNTNKEKYKDDNDGYYKKAAEFFSNIFNDVAGRINRKEAMIEMGKDIVMSSQRYNSLNSFEGEMKPLFEALDKYEEASTMKKWLTSMKKIHALNDFKKRGLSDLENISNGTIHSNFEINRIVESIFVMKSDIDKDEMATSIFNKMSTEPKIKTEFEGKMQRDADLRHFRELIHDNNLTDWMSGIAKFYGINSLTTVLPLSHEWGEDYKDLVVPELDKDLAVLKRMDMKNAEFGTAGYGTYVISHSLTDDEIIKYKELRDTLEEYAFNKKEVYGNEIEAVKEAVEFDFSQPMSIDDIPASEPKSKNDSYYRDTLDNVEFAYDRFDNPHPSLSAHHAVMHMAHVKADIDRLPSQAEDPSDALKIAFYKDAVLKSDTGMMVEFGALRKYHENLRNNGVFTKLVNDPKNIDSKIMDRYNTEVLEKIVNLVDRVESKHGKAGIPIYNEVETIGFDNYQLIAKSYKEYKNNQELKAVKKLTV